MEIWITKSGQTENFRRNVPGILLEAGLIFLVNGIGTMLFLTIFTSKAPGRAFLLSVFLTALFCLVLEKRKHSLIMGLLAAGVFCGSLFCLWDQIMEGFIWLWNEIGAFLGKRAGIYITMYTQKEITPTSQMIFLCFLGIVTAVAGFFLIKARLYVLLFLFALVLPFFMVYTDSVPDTNLCLVFYIGVILEINYVCFPGKRDGTAEVSSFLTGMAVTVILGGISIVLVKNLIPQNSYENSQLVSNAKEECLEAVQQFRYGGTKINSLPDGNLKKVSSWSGSEETALQITMEHPASLYLRGFVGSSYDGTSWKPASTETAYETRNLFYWLHQDGFYGETQLSNAWNLLNHDSESGKKGGITVKNKNANSKYLYLPYETESLPEGYQKESTLSDSTIGAKGVLGQRDYSFVSRENLVKDFTSLSARIYQALTEGKESSYRKDESYYNEFVYENDTALPSALEKLFLQELGDGGNREQGHTDYYTAISRIRAYLEKNMTYSPEPEPFTGKGDFTEEFLTKTKIGHSVHFATAATLMFRYYGIPSRYVEGYLITPEDLEGKKEGDTLEIPGKNGHAWTEIYIDGLGWIPLEMTPAYYGIMEEADLKTGLEAKGQKPVSLPEVQPDSQRQENVKTHWSLKLALFGMEKFFLLLLLIFDIFCLLFMLVVFFLRVQANYKRRKRFRQKDNRIAVCAMAGYAKQLYGHGFCGKKELDEKQIYSLETIRFYKEIDRIGKKAAFSSHGITDGERRDAASCVRLMLLELKKGRNWYDKWIMKYIERLY